MYVILSKYTVSYIQVNTDKDQSLFGQSRAIPNPSCAAVAAEGRNRPEMRPKIVFCNTDWWVLNNSSTSSFRKPCLLKGEALHSDADGCWRAGSEGQLG
jgi:hypothetical protein